MQITVVDLETTGVEETDQILEVAAVDVIDGEVKAESAWSCLSMPTIEIPPEAMAVHHITLEDVMNAPSWDDVRPKFLTRIFAADAMCAHNAKFEQQFLRAETDKPWICTMKCAMRAWPDAPGFSNQVLRYWLNPAGLDRKRANETHRALPDAYVTAFLVRELLKLHPLETLLHWSIQIPMPPKMNFGKHKGMSWSDVPLDYLHWIAYKSDMDEDTKLLACHHRDARMYGVARDAYMRLARFAVDGARTLEELRDWFAREKPEREKHKIIPGTQQYQDLLYLCELRKKTLVA